MPDRKRPLIEKADIEKSNKTEFCNRIRCRADHIEHTAEWAFLAEAVEELPS